MRATRQRPTGRQTALTEYDEAFESHLLSYLGQVQPRPEFVHKLKTRLTNEPRITLEKRSRMAAYVVAAFGLFAGALIIWIVIGIRSLFFRETVRTVS